MWCFFTLINFRYRLLALNACFRLHLARTTHHEVFFVPLSVSVAGGFFTAQDCKAEMLLDY